MGVKAVAGFAGEVEINADGVARRGMSAAVGLAVRNPLAAGGNSHCMVIVGIHCNASAAADLVEENIIDGFHQQ